MSYELFKPTIWSKHIQHELETECILVDFCNKQFQGEAGLGKTVKINGVGRPKINPYTPGEEIAAPEEVEGTSALLEINQADYFNFAIDDVDKAQSQEGLMDHLMTEATRALAENADKYVASLASTEGVSASGSTTVADKKSALALVNQGILALRENNVGTKERIAVEIPWFMYNLLRDDIIDLKTDNDELIKKGIIGMYDNCFIRATNNLWDDGTDFYAMVRTQNAIAFANGIENTEAYRPEKSFSDAVKGLHCYGAKIIRPKELYVLKCHKKAA